MSLYTLAVCKLFLADKTRNPLTGRPIQAGKATYTRLEKECKKHAAVAPAPKQKQKAKLFEIGRNEYLPANHASLDEFYVRLAQLETAAKALKPRIGDLIRIGGPGEEHHETRDVYLYDGQEMRTAGQYSFDIVVPKHVCQHLSNAMAHYSKILGTVCSFIVFEVSENDIGYQYMTRQFPDMPNIPATKMFVLGIQDGKLVLEYEMKKSRALKFKTMEFDNPGHHIRAIMKLK